MYFPVNFAKFLRTSFLENTYQLLLVFSPLTILEWNKLNFNICDFKTLSTLNFKLSSPKNTFNCYNSSGIRYITRLSPGLSHFGLHKFKYSFQELNPMCHYGSAVETTTPFYCKIRI